MTAFQGIRRSCRRVGVVGLIVALFTLRAVVPVGYMPAAIGDGGPFVLCHGASAATLAMLNAHEGMHHADTTASGDPESPAPGHDERWERCELGVGSADAALASVVPVILVDATPVAVPSTAVSQPDFFRPARYRARAPPS